MAESKRDEMRSFFEREVNRAISETIADLINREYAEAIRINRSLLASAVAWHLCEQYRFLELADIMEWKRTRERR